MPKHDIMAKVVTVPGSERIQLTCLCGWQTDPYVWTRQPFEKWVDEEFDLLETHRLLEETAVKHLEADAQ